ncbi:MAG TPA: hypothetical protein VFJ57_11395 [Solirubrobacterales bacterium]|nr:hypothetical protein [Solirubrobacterales bacterium]
MSQQRRVEEQIPSLAGAAYRITSPADPDYNCVSWALRDTARWWSPGLDRRNHWPDDVPAWPSLTAFVELFERDGYKRCGNPDLEEGVEKIAIFANAIGEPAHVARQLKGGKWTSKLGSGVDIEHDELDAVACGLLGRVKVIMCRDNPDIEAERPTFEVVSGS